MSGKTSVRCDLNDADVERLDRTRLAEQYPRSRSKWALDAILAQLARDEATAPQEEVQQPERRRRRRA